MATKEIEVQLLFNHQFRIVRLNEGDTKQFHYSEPTDEGFSYEEVTLEYHHGYVRKYEESGGRDCDGMHSYYTTVVYKDCHQFGELSPNEKYQWPWVEEEDRNTEVYDQFAQLAGY